MTEEIYLETSPYIADKGEKIGLAPGSITKSDLRALGHPESPIKAIRAKCIDCCVGRMDEVRKCVSTSCALWPYRMGRNPFHAKAGKRTSPMSSD
jgi:hypothetical protein